MIFDQFDAYLQYSQWGPSLGTVKLREGPLTALLLQFKYYRSQQRAGGGLRPGWCWCAPGLGSWDSATVNTVTILGLGDYGCKVGICFHI